MSAYVGLCQPMFSHNFTTKFAYTSQVSIIFATSAIYSVYIRTQTHTTTRATRARTHAYTHTHTHTHKHTNTHTHTKSHLSRMEHSCSSINIIYLTAYKHPLPSSRPHQSYDDNHNQEPQVHGLAPVLHLEFYGCTRPAHFVIRLLLVSHNSPTDVYKQ